MFQSAFTAPSAEATRTGIALLEDGASAVEAMVAAAATIAVSYPHMNSIGGDGFWLVLPAHGDPVGILAGGFSGARIGPRCWEYGRAERGVDAMLTVPGAVGGWAEALSLADELWGARRPLSDLLADSIRLAADGCPVSRSLEQNLSANRAALEELPGFAELFTSQGMPSRGDVLRNPELASLLELLVQNGLDDFYRGAAARRIADGLNAVGSHLDGDDLARYRARRVRPLSLELSGDTVLNLPAPTQGLASLLILGMYHRMRGSAATPSDHVHILVEATKRAFEIRDRYIGDPDTTSVAYGRLLGRDSIERLCQQIDPARATPWPRGGPHADTVWMGASDRFGNMVSYIQSLYWEFGSGVVVPGTGMLWTNRGLCFDSEPGGVNHIGPHRIPRHTLNPAAALFADGRRMVYGTMGGEGQPQTQGAMWWRYTVEGRSVEEAVAAPRWLLGRTWGEESASLKIERTLADDILDDLVERGHHVVAVKDGDENMGHAGVVVRHGDDVVEASCDPRSDGAACTSADA